MMRSTSGDVAYVQLSHRIDPQSGLVLHQSSLLNGFCPRFYRLVTFHHTPLRFHYVPDVQHMETQLLSQWLVFSQPSPSVHCGCQDYKSFFKWRKCTYFLYNEVYSHIFPDLKE